MSTPRARARAATTEATPGPSTGCAAGLAPALPARGHLARRARLAVPHVARARHQRRQRPHLQRHVRVGAAPVVPIALAGLGGLWAERAGVVNIGLEGMMILGTWFGRWGGVQSGPWAGVLPGSSGARSAGWCTRSPR